MDWSVVWVAIVVLVFAIIGFVWARDRWQGWRGARREARRRRQQ